MVFNASFNNISVILWRSVIGGGNRSTERKPPTCHKSLTKLYEYISFKHISFTTAYEWIPIQTLFFLHVQGIHSVKSI
jgi:hypothetical protein